MDAERINCFLMLADTLSFTRAAELLYKSQSVLSRQISAMEEELGFALFVRDSKSVSLTPAGAHFAEGLRVLRERYGKLLSEAAAISSGCTGSISIGTLGGEAIDQYSSGLLRAFQARYPDVRVTMSAHRHGELLRMVHGGALDFAFGVPHGAWLSPEFDYVTVGVLRNCLYFNDSHPLAGADPSGLTLADFKNDTFILFADYDSGEDNCPTARRCAQFGFIPRFVRVQDLDTLMVMLESGQGVSINNDCLVLKNNPRIHALFLDGLGSMEEGLFWNRGGVTASSELLIRFAREYGGGRDFGGKR